MPDSRLIAVVDDQTAQRQWVERVLQRAGHRVLLFASGGEFLSSDLPADLSCIILDLRMPGLDGFEVLSVLQERRVTVPVVVLTGHGGIKIAVDAMRGGAADFLEKPPSPEQLLETIGRAIADQPKDDAKTKIAALTAREREVLDGVLRGLSNKSIAEALGLSLRTVEAHRLQILDELGVASTSDAVRIAVAAGLGGGDGGSGG